MRYNRLRYHFTKFPMDDVTAVIVKDCAEIIPTPSEDFKIGKISFAIAHVQNGSSD
jgi:hypothetical protein